MEPATSMTSTGTSLLIALRRLADALAQDGGLPAEQLRYLAPQVEAVRAQLDELQEDKVAAHARQPAKASDSIRLGLADAQRGDYERAVIGFTSALHADPGNATAHVHRGDAYRLQGRFDLALADYSNALEMDPENLAALLNRST